MIRCAVDWSRWSIRRREIDADDLVHKKRQKVETVKQNEAYDTCVSVDSVRSPEPNGLIFPQAGKRSRWTIEQMSHESEQQIRDYNII